MTNQEADNHDALRNLLSLKHYERPDKDAHQRIRAGIRSEIASLEAPKKKKEKEG